MTIDPESAASSFPRREYPCAPCPIRADNVNNPHAKFPAARWRALSTTAPDPLTGEHPTLGDPIFGCHKGDPKTGGDLACAGWLAQFGEHHVSVRLALAQGRLPAEALRPGPKWPPLHATWDEVVHHQTDDDR